MYCCRNTLQIVVVLQQLRAHNFSFGGCGGVGVGGGGACAAELELYVTYALF